MIIIRIKIIVTMINRDKNEAKRKEKKQQNK